MSTTSRRHHHPPPLLLTPSATGDAEGLGETRKKELVKSAMMLGIQDEDDVLVLDNP